MTVSSSEYVAEIERWRGQSEETFRRDWVSLAGRFELDPGSYRVGADAEADIRLPEGSGPRYVGELNFADGAVQLAVAPGVELAVNGEPASGTVALRSDKDAGGPDVVSLGALSWFVIVRGPRTIVRLRDADSPALRRFGGRRWLPVDEGYRVEGVFTPYDPPKPLMIANILGDEGEEWSPGYVTFRLHGGELRLDAGGWRDGGLLLHFRDATNGDTTYGGGRSLVTSVPNDGLVTVDFNRASNLPCAFTEFATCPLPPAQNRLPVRVDAGELLPDPGSAA